jgi:hypothetical protein
MENQQQNWDPIQWENHYLQQLQNDVNNQSQYTSQITKNMMMGYFNQTTDNWNILNQMKTFRQHLEEYNLTSTWFLERKLNRFSDFLIAVKADLDKAIQIHTQTYISGINAQKTDSKIVINSQKEIFDVYQKMHADRVAAFDKTNEMWRRNF